MTKLHLWTRIYRRAVNEADRLRRENQYYQWYVFTRKLSRWKEERLLPHYTQEETDQKKCCGEEVVVVHNGWVESGGLADRLRGIVSTYLLCKELNREFRLLFTHPFPLDMFLLPNTYDWRIDEEGMTFSLQQSFPLFLEVGGESHWQTQKQKAWLKQRLEACKGKQAHIYTNALFAYHEDFQGAFHELFKPSERLQSSIDRELANLGHNYVSVSARFLDALGDFSDTVKVGVLPEDKQEQLLQACMAGLGKIHSNHPDAVMLVNSDSTTFLRRAQELPYVHIIPGTILHLDIMPNEAEAVGIYETYEKTFLDFFMIANAQHVYRLDHRWMRASGFPLAASMVYGKPFNQVKCKTA